MRQHHRSTVIPDFPGKGVTDTETICCGSGAGCWFPESCAKLCEDRLQEAAQTGAERLVTICHYCGQTFAADEWRFDFSVRNYVQLVAEAMGIEREDKFKRYTLWGNSDRIVKDAHEHILESPFDKERIVEVIQAVFTPMLHKQHSKE